MKTCGNCKSFDKGQGVGMGYCYLSPPTVFIVGMQPPTLAGGQPRPVTVSARPTVGEKERACAMYQEKN